MDNKFYITTPIYYVNAKPHIGHTYTTIAADVLARYHRLSGDKTFFATGTDEHGAKIEEKAREAGMEPRAFADVVAGEFKNAWNKFAISNDKFIRTTDPNHIKAVRKALDFMREKEDIYPGAYEGLYCRGCEQYLSEKDLVDGKCPDHLAEPEKMREETYMFRISKYADALLKKIKSEELKIRPLEKRNEIISFYEKEGLKDVSFSRKNVKWGIPLPWDESHTAYVWSDAFLNYLTILGWDGSGKKHPDMFPPEVQLMSKDILRVHATIWPAMLLSLELPLPKQIFVHGFFLVDGKKMSKSLGNVIPPEELVERYGVDASRYLLMSAATFGRDGDIGWDKFDKKYTADLANGIGNLVSRVSRLLEQNGIAVDISAGSGKELQNRFEKNMQAMELDRALEVLWQKMRQSDEILSDKKPWKLEDKNEIKSVLEPLAQNILNIARLLIPFMPETAEKIMKQFSEKQIKKGGPLFPRLSSSLPS